MFETKIPKSITKCEIHESPKSGSTGNPLQMFYVNFSDFGQGEIWQQGRVLV